MVTILQQPIVSDFILPFLLIFFLVFGILMKTKIFGDKNPQLNAFIAFIVGLVFVAAIEPKLIVENLVLTLTVAIVVVFIILLLWGFVAGEGGLKFENAPNALKWFVGIVFVIFALAALLWATGAQGGFFDFLFRQGWSSDFWTNFAFLAVIIIALVVVLKKN
ncbi:MAG TPA: hypothetical protein ENI22_00270 [Candidatus Pacearchaeota archaeon]|nr:hypothetical protein [Candidatus Pacearchaeota archaeon]